MSGMQDGIREFVELIARNAEMAPYSDEWWDTIAQALLFLPEGGRVSFLESFVAFVMEECK